MLMFVRVLDPMQRIVLRLWPSRYFVDLHSAPCFLYVGSVTRETLHPFAQLATFVETTDGGTAIATRALTQALAASSGDIHVERVSDRPLVLIW